MSTRYVWDVYNTKADRRPVEKKHQSGVVILTSISSTYAMAKASSYKIGSTDSGQKVFELENPTWLTSFLSTDASSQRYLIVDKANSQSATASSIRMLYNDAQEDYDEPLYWATVERTSSGANYSYAKYILVKKSGLDGLSDLNYYARAQDYTIFEMEDYLAQGDTKTGAVSSSSSEAHPDDGAYGSSWYVYQGSDSIDPLSISYSNSKPERGDSVSVMVNAPQDNLGGIISYLYQYSTDGGNTWTTAGSATSDTQKEITVPDNAEQFMARVRAQDDIGFTSLDYVAGANLEVRTMHLWVGVDGAARRGRKLWVGVNGAARQVVRAWVGDGNGKAKRWF